MSCLLWAIQRPGSCKALPLGTATTREIFYRMMFEFIATLFRLVSVIWGCSRACEEFVPFVVGAYITAAYWFTASTSFANPAVTIARSLRSEERRVGKEGRFRLSAYK